MALILNLENKKCLTLKQEHRGALHSALLETGWTIEEIKKRALALEKADTYQNIGIDKWHNCLQEEKFTVQENEREAFRKAKQIIEGRKKEFIQLNSLLDSEEMEKELARAGLEEAESYFKKIKEARLNVFSEIRLKALLLELFKEWLATNYTQKNI